MNEYDYVALKNLSIIILTGFAVYITQNAWALLALYFLTSIKKEEAQ